ERAPRALPSFPTRRSSDLGLTGRGLQAYLAAGVASDHEATTLEEGREKLRAGAYLMVREGSVTRDLAAMLPLLEPGNAGRIGLRSEEHTSELQSRENLVCR